MKPKLTPWFPESVNPVRPGWYEVYKCTSWSCSGFHHWDARTRQWDYDGVPLYGSLPWRGLTENPK